MHALAIGYSPTYLAQNGDGIRQDWPRIPLPTGRDALLASADLGRRVAALLDTEARVPGVTVTPFRAELKGIGVVSRVGGGQLGVDEDGLAINVGWGHRGRGGICMPGSGRLVERDYESAEMATIRTWAETAGLTIDKALALLGERTTDVYLNASAYWRNVPSRVWDYTIGGYQVVKKWLSYRERDLLGRPLRPDEAREVRDMTRRLAALRLLEVELDSNYEAVRTHAFTWSPNGSI